MITTITLTNTVARSAPPPRHRLPQMRINRPRHDLFGEEKWPISKEKGQEPFPQWAFTGFILHSNTGKAHQSLSGSKDQTIGNIQRTLRAYSESGSDS